MPRTEGIRSLISATQGVVLSLHIDIVTATLVLPRFCGAAKSVVEHLTLQHIVAVTCLVAGGSYGPISVVITESGLALCRDVVEITNDLGKGVQRIVVKAGDHGTVCIMGIAGV